MIDVVSHKFMLVKHKFNMVGHKFNMVGHKFNLVGHDSMLYKQKEHNNREQMQWAASA